MCLPSGCTTSFALLFNCEFYVFVSRHFAVSQSSDGSYFIDRSPKWFPHILDYLRSHTLALDLLTLKPSDRQELRQEVEFYGYDSLLAYFEGTGCCFAMNSCPAGVTLADKLKTVTVVEKIEAARNWCRTIISTLPTPDSNGAMEFKIRHNGNATAMIGWGEARESAGIWTYCCGV